MLYNLPLSGVPLEELTELIKPLPRFRAVQVFKWIAGGVSGFKEMSNLPLSLRDELAGRFSLRPCITEEKQIGDDGTIKQAMRLSDGAMIEAVLLADASGRRTVPNTARYTACLSTQAGCPAGCVFCKTGALGFFRNLNSAEIVEQFFLLKKTVEGIAPPTEGSPVHPISSIVVMGMGEPLLNLAELRRAIDVITSPQGMHFSRRRITVSTCGITGGIIDLADNGPAVRLALSLTSADEGLRRRLMPITASQSLPALKEALGYFQARGGGRITLEVVLLGGINTSGEDAAGIAQFAENLDTAVNLIPWNPVKGLQFEGNSLQEPSAAEVKGFMRHLKALGMNVTCRFRRGRGVTGACGQLGHLPINLDAVSACGSLS